jgi:hypothetical protein
MDSLLHEQKERKEEIHKQTEKLRLQNIFFSFSSSVFMKTGQLLATFLSGSEISARQLAIQIFVTSLSDATGDAYSLSVANTSSNLETYDVKALINFFLSFISKFLTGLIHVFLHSLGIPVKYILVVDLFLFYSTIGLSSYLIKKNQDLSMSFAKLLTLQSIYATFFLGLIVTISRIFVSYI